MNPTVVVTSVEQVREFQLYPGAHNAEAMAKAHAGIDSPVRKVYMIQGYSTGHFEPYVFYQGKYYHLFNNKHLVKPSTLVVAHGNPANLTLTPVPNATGLMVQNPKEAGPKRVKVITTKRDVNFTDAYAWKHTDEKEHSNHPNMIPFCGEAYEMSPMETSRLSKPLRDANSSRWLEQSKTVSSDSTPKP